MAKLQKEVLKEIPKQLQQYFQLNGIFPPQTLVNKADNFYFEQRDFVVRQLVHKGRINSRCSSTWTK